MIVHVLFFGATADWVGRRDLDVTTGDKATVTEVLEQLMDEYPDLRHRRLQSSINQTYAAGETVLQAGDELAFFTAVSGG